MAKKNKNAKRNNRLKQTNNNNRNQQKKSAKQNSIEDNVEEELNLLNEKMDSMTLQQKSSMIIDAEIQLSERPSGLPNLGNTCYFNSIMQVMGQTYILHHALKERCRKDFIWHAKRFYWNEKTQSFSSETLNLKLPTPTPLIIDFLQLQQQIFQQRSPNPSALLRDVRLEKHQFEGYAQQDAQELLITLLDALKKAESLRQQKSLIDALKISDAKNPSNEDREKAQQYKITAKHTVVDAIFGGQLLSIIHCTVCDYRSFTFEPFIDLALSLDCDKHTIDSDEDDYVDNKNFNTAKEKQQKSVGNKNKKNKSGKKKSNNNSNKETSTDDDDDDDDSKTLLEPLDDDDDQEIEEKINPQNKKKLRQEKKAARRAERKRIKAEKQQSNLKKTISNDDLSNNESNSNPDNIDNVNGNVSSAQEEEEEEENEEKETVTNQKSSEICKQNEVGIKNDSNSSIENDSELFDSENSTSDSTTASSSSSSSTNSSPSHSNRIEDNFRFKFYSFAHQRMSSMQDDDHQNLDLGRLLRSFIKKETLDGSNKYLCENCSKLNNGLKTYSKAFKCQLIALPPPILILQLKRFEASGFGFNKRMIASMHKLNTKISFPEKLYLAPYTSRIYEHFSRFYEPECDPEAISNMNDKRLEYTLYGVVIHSGSLRYGHYMAYVCVRPDSFQCDKLKRFLHLKPFVSNIEHILHVVHERFLENGEQKTSMTKNHDSSGYANFDGNNSSDNSDNDFESSSSSSSNKNKSNSSKRKWYFISDSNVSTISIESVLKDATSPYLLFYERTK